MNYKEKTEEFIKDLNLLLSDTILFPEYNGGKFVLKFNIQDRKATCDLIFEENDLIHSIMHKTCVWPDNDSVDLESFYKQCYWQVLRYLLFSEDYVNNKENGYPNVLSLKTLAYTGLDKLK